MYKNLARSQNYLRTSMVPPQVAEQERMARGYAEIIIAGIATARAVLPKTPIRLENIIAVIANAQHAANAASNYAIEAASATDRGNIADAYIAIIGVADMTRQAAAASEYAAALTGSVAAAIEAKIGPTAEISAARMAANDAFYTAAAARNLVRRLDNESRLLVPPAPEISYIREVADKAQAAAGAAIAAINAAESAAVAAGYARIEPI